MVKLVIFDWNGTLVADVQACMETYNHILKVWGGRQVNVESFRDTIRIPAIEFYIQHGCDKDQLIRDSKKISTMHYLYYTKKTEKLRTRKGTKRLLNWLFQQQIESIILSSHSIGGIQNQLERLLIRKYISTILANTNKDDFIYDHSKIELLKDYIKQITLKPSEIMIVGDSTEELDLGNTKGMVTVAITGGYSSKNRLKKSKPNYIISNLSQLKTILESTSNN